MSVEHDLDYDTQEDPHLAGREGGRMHLAVKVALGLPTEVI